MERKVKNMTTSKTVRLDDRVIKYIEAYRGDNFSDKLRNYVLEHEERRDQIVDDWNRLQAQVSDKDGTGSCKTPERGRRTAETLGRRHLGLH